MTTPRFVIPFFAIFFFLLLAGDVYAAEHLPAPTIAIHPDIYYPLDEILYLEGRTAPNATIQVQFQKHGARLVNLNVKSDGNGEWVLTEKVPLKAGNWEVRARLVDSLGKTSSWSNSRIIKTIVTGITIGGITIKYSFLLALLFIILTASAIIAVYWFLKIRWFQSKIQTDRVKELEKQLAIKVIEDGFADLRRSIIEELEHLDSKLGNGGLSKEEEDHRKNLLRELRQLEDAIEKKIDDIT